jgi:hypothetical protein
LEHTRITQFKGFSTINSGTLPAVGWHGGFKSNTNGSAAFNPRTGPRRAANWRNAELTVDHAQDRSVILWGMVNKTARQPGNGGVRDV